MHPLILAALPHIPKLVSALVQAWNRTEKKVTLEEWLGSFGRDRSMDQIIAEAKERREQRLIGAPIAEPAFVLSAPDGLRVATAYEILVAAQTGDMPDWFTPAERHAATSLRADLLMHS